MNSIDANEATQRIRSMQGKSSSEKPRLQRSKKPAGNKRDNEQDLVQKYIINPKKDDARYNKKEKKPMDSGTFKLLLVLVLVVGFTVGVGYGVFNLDFNNLSNTTSVATVTDTAFPEIHENIVENTTNNNYTYTYSDYDYSSNYDVETTQDTSQDSQASPDSYSEGSQSEGPSDPSEVNTEGG